MSGVTIQNCVMDVCPKCGNVYPELPQPKEAKRAIARALIEADVKLWGDAILFLRKAMNMSSQAFADAMRASRMTVSRWENDHAGISGANDFRLRLLAVENLFHASEQAGIVAEVNRVIKIAYQEETKGKGVALKHTTVAPASPDGYSAAIMS
jgi:DNA-binding transcriptional regulator YiaG